MVFRKTTIDNSVRCIPKSEQTKENLLNKTEKFHKITKNSLKL